MSTPFNGGDATNHVVDEWIDGGNAWGPIGNVADGGSAAYSTGDPVNGVWVAPADRNLVFQAADAWIAQQQANQFAITPRFLVTMYDETYKPLGEINDYISCTATFKHNGVGTATIVMKGDDPLVPWALQCQKTVRPIVINVNGMRWSGRIDTVSDDIVDGVNTVTLQCLDDWNWFNKILVWVNPFLPIEVQWALIGGKENVMIGPAITVLKSMILSNVIRLQAGLWSIVNEPLNLDGWFASSMLGMGMQTPVAVMPMNPFTDTSKWVALEARFDTVATLAEQILKDNGLNLTATLWLPGDPQPHPSWHLKEATIVVDVKDKSGVIGPTGTFLDGIIETGVDMVDSMWGEVLSPLNGTTYLPPGVNIAPAFGVNWIPPWTVYNADDPRSGMKECHITAHHPLARTVVGGGKSPQWVNKLIDTILEFLLGAILVGIGVTGVANTLLDGVFDDVILAFQQITNTRRMLTLGRYGYPEYWTGTEGTAYTLNEFFALETALWDTRGYFSYQFTTYDGIPYTFGRDMGIGDLVSVIRRGQVYTDYMMEATVTDDRSTRVQLLAKIGDNSAQESPWSIFQRKLSGFEDAIQKVLLAE